MKTASLPFARLVLAAAMLATPAFGMISIDYVNIGDAGNVADTAEMVDSTTGYGAVAYAYQIAKNETTIAQYAEFLNAVAKTDTYELYSTDMTTDYINGISRSGSPDSYSYSVHPGSENKPVTYVSWFDAARFANWLHHGQPTGLQTTGTTEDGAYSLLGAVTGTGFVKEPDAKVWIPSEDEWYKAAYYDPNKGGVGVGGYWAQATQSDTVAGNTLGEANSANYYETDYVGYPGMALTDVGAYGMNSASAYGTNDQAGNVWEWNDAVIDSSRGLRGGSWFNFSFALSSSLRNSFPGTDGYYYIGFRVASVPEPTAIFLTMLGGSVMLIRRNR